MRRLCNAWSTSTATVRAKGCWSGCRLLKATVKKRRDEGIYEDLIIFSSRVRLFVFTCIGHGGGEGGLQAMLVSVCRAALGDGTFVQPTHV